MKTFQGKLQAKGLKIGIVLSRFNQFIGERLLEGALDALHKLVSFQAEATSVIPHLLVLFAAAWAVGLLAVKRFRYE